MLNAGGWNNTASAIEGLEDDNSSPISLVVEPSVARPPVHIRAVRFSMPVCEATPSPRVHWPRGVTHCVSSFIEKCKARITFTNGDVEHTGRVIVLKAEYPFLRSGDCRPKKHKKPSLPPVFLTSNSITWSTQTQFRNLKVTDANGNVIKADMNDDTQWVTPRGQWTRGDGFGQTFSARSTMTCPLLGHCQPI